MFPYNNIRNNNTKLSIIMDMRITIVKRRNIVRKMIIRRIIITMRGSVTFGLGVSKILQAYGPAGQGFGSNQASILASVIL